MEKFLSLVADVMDVDKDEICLDTLYGKFEIWDSLMMMRIIMEVEEKYGCIIPIEDISKINSLNDLYKYTLE